MFGMRSEPSAEALAGSGPTTTYPPPPSASATPESIASIAGGTAVPVTPGVPTVDPGQPAGGFNVSPGFPASPQTNMAAAQANGFGTMTKPVGYTTPQPKKPSGYSFGAKTFTPKTESTTPGGFASGSSYNKSAAYTPPASSYAIPNRSATPTPPVTTPSSTPSAAPSGGFTLPTGISPALAAASTRPEPTQPSVSTESMETPTTPPGGFSPPAAKSPEFSTASAANITAPSQSISPPIPSSTPNGYSPGSTAEAGGYPTGGFDEPATTGSFYR